MTRLPLFLGLAGLAAVAAVANAVAPPAGDGRLGAAVRGDMAQRDSEMARRKRKLDLQEQALRAIGQRWGGGQVPAAAPAPRPVAPGEVAETVADRDERIIALARIYGSMKPRAAAPVFQKLPTNLQVEVARRMPNRSTAMLLAAMDPEAAASLSVAMAQQGPPPGIAADGAAAGAPR